MRGDCRKMEELTLDRMRQESQSKIRPLPFKWRTPKSRVWYEFSRLSARVNTQKSTNRMSSVAVHKTGYRPCYRSDSFRNAGTFHVRLEICVRARTIVC